MRLPEWCACLMMAVVVTLIGWAFIWMARAMGQELTIFVMFCTAFVSSGIAIMTSPERRR